MRIITIKNAMPTNNGLVITSINDLLSVASDEGGFCPSAELGFKGHALGCFQLIT